MNFLFVVLIFVCYVPLSAQSSEQVEDTLWIDPFIGSLKMVLSNAGPIDFVLLDQKHADVVNRLLSGVNIAHSVSEIESNATPDQMVYYVCLTSFKIDSWTAQITWQNISVGYSKRTQQLYSTLNLNCEFIYHYDGTSWSAGPSSIQTINHSRQDNDN